MDCCLPAPPPPHPHPQSSKCASAVPIWWIVPPPTPHPPSSKCTSAVKKSVWRCCVLSTSVSTLPIWWIAACPHPPYPHPHPHPHSSKCASSIERVCLKALGTQYFCIHSTHLMDCPPPPPPPSKPTSKCTSSIKRECLKVPGSQYFCICSTHLMDCSPTPPKQACDIWFNDLLQLLEGLKKSVQACRLCLSTPKRKSLQDLVNSRTRVSMCSMYFLLLCPLRDIQVTLPG